MTLAALSGETWHPRLTLPTVREYLDRDNRATEALLLYRNGGRSTGLGVCLTSVTVMLALIIWLASTGLLALTALTLGVTGSAVLARIGHQQVTSARALADHTDPTIREAMADDIAATYGLTVQPGALPLFPFEPA